MPITVPKKSLYKRDPRVARIRSVPTHYSQSLYVRLCDRGNKCGADVAWRASSTPTIDSWHLSDNYRERVNTQSIGKTFKRRLGLLAWIVVDYSYRPAKYPPPFYVSLGLLSTAEDALDNISRLLSVHKAQYMPPTRLNSTVESRRRWGIKLRWLKGPCHKLRVFTAAKRLISRTLDSFVCSMSFLGNSRSDFHEIWRICSSAASVSIFMFEQWWATN